jgi:hypothetical protein
MLLKLGHKPDSNPTLSASSNLVICKPLLTVKAFTGEVLTEYRWYVAGAVLFDYTRSKVRERCRSFLRYCCAVRWLDRVLPLENNAAHRGPVREAN